jgi:F0F1-type ATP synthase assembly protein I
MWNSPVLGFVGIGSYLAAAIVVPTIIGHALDGRFGTEPVLTLVFLLVGLIAGFFGAYRQLQDLLRRQQADRE